MKSSAISISRLRSFVFGFPGVHTLNAVLGLCFTILQTFVLARNLHAHEYIATVAMTAVILYTNPLNQALGRVNFLSLRMDVVREQKSARRDGASVMFYLNNLALFAVAVGAPAIVSDNLELYLCLVAFTLYAAQTMLWSYEVQMCLLATNRQMTFEAMTVVRWVFAFACLAEMHFLHNFKIFCIGLATTAIASHIWAIQYLLRLKLLVAAPRVSAKELGEHLRMLWTSVQAMMGEWLTLNSPYLIFVLRFNVGPSLVMIDATMKVLRFVLTVTRNLCEITLPRLSREIFSAGTDKALLLAFGAMGVCLCFGLGVAGAIVLFEQRVFQILLGPNNFVPHGAGWPIAVCLVSGVAFQVGSFVVGFFARKAAVMVFTIGAAAISIALGLTVYYLSADQLSAMWWYAGSMAVSAAVAVLAMWWTIKLFDQPETRETLASAPSA
jgi:hypothetical protein